MTLLLRSLGLGLVPLGQNYGTHTMDRMGAFRIWGEILLFHQQLFILRVLSSHDVPGTYIVGWNGHKQVTQLLIMEINRVIQRTNQMRGEIMEGDYRQDGWKVISELRPQG